MTLSRVLINTQSGAIGADPCGMLSNVRDGNGLSGRWFQMGCWQDLILALCLVLFCSSWGPMSVDFLLALLPLGLRFLDSPIPLH